MNDKRRREVAFPGARGTGSSWFCRVLLSPPSSFSLSLSSRSYIISVIISAVKQTNERQKNRSGDGGKGFSEEVTFSVPWQVLGIGEEHFWQEIVWCVYRIKNRSVWLEHSE